MTEQEQRPETPEESIRALRAIQQAQREQQMQRKAIVLMENAMLASTMNPDGPKEWQQDFDATAERFIAEFEAMLNTPRGVDGSWTALLAAQQALMKRWGITPEYAQQALDIQLKMTLEQRLREQVFPRK